MFTFIVDTLDANFIYINERIKHDWIKLKRQNEVIVNHFLSP